MKKTLVATVSLLLGSLALAEGITLPAPTKTGGMPLMEALAKRATSRRTTGPAPTAQQLTDLLWAANGVTRPDGKRTAPSARDRREIQLAVLTEKGLYTWDPVDNALTETPACVDLEDQRRGASAVLVLYYDKGIQDRENALVDAGFVGQNIYLFCTSKGWPSVFMGTMDRKKFATALGVDEDAVLFMHRIGVK